MIIDLSKEIRIRGTAQCWQLERKHQRNGVGDWKAFSYYTKFADAVGAACQREIRTHPANTLTDAIEAAHAVATKYGQLLDCAPDKLGKRDNPDNRENADLHSLIRLAS